MRRVVGLVGSLLLPLLMGAVAAPVVSADEALSSAAARIRGWRWRPGHAELVGRARIEGREMLIGRDPDTGRLRRIADLDRVRSRVARSDAGVPPRRIGRAAAPEFIWEPSGGGFAAVAQGDLVWSDLGIADESGFSRRLTRTRSALQDVKVAPGGGHVSFVRDHELWVVPTRRGRPRQLTFGGTAACPNAELDWMIAEEFGLSTAHWWSPDGRRIAFLQIDPRDVPEVEIDGTPMRYPRVGDPLPVSRVGIVPAAGGRTVWADLGVDEGMRAYVPRVAWTPDAQHLAVTVLDRPQRHLHLLEAPVSGATARVLLHEHDPRWVTTPPSPLFVDAGRFLWRSERDGWARWYLATRRDDGVRLEPLTGAGMEAWERPSLDPAGGPARYVASIDAGLRRQGRVGADGRPAPFASQAKTDYSVQFDATGRWALVRSSRRMQRPSVRLCRLPAGRGHAPLGPVPPSSPSPSSAPRSELGHLGSGPDRITWRLWHPPGDPPEEPRPLVVHVYGGPGSRSVRAAWGGHGLAQWFTERGTYVLQVDGRGTRGYGTEHARQIHGRLGLLEIQDQVRAVQHVTARPEIDARRVGITGSSFGGTMTCLAMLRHPDVFHVGVAMASVTDWRLYDAAYAERYLGLFEENPQGYAEASPISYAAALQGRLLLMHGEADDNVHVENTTRLAAAIEAARRGDLLDVILFPGVGHGFGRHRGAAWQRAYAFLDAGLRN